MRSSPRGACPVCGGTNFRLLYRDIGHEFERCIDCTFDRMADGMAGSELSDYYESERAQGEACWQEHGDNLTKYGKMIARLERWVAPGRFLDVGCSIGTSLVAARERGWEVLGVELSRPVAAFGREEWDLDIRTEPLEELALPAGHFDVVWMHHTLEHVEEPDLLLAESARVLAPGGVMYQVMPNHAGLKGRLLGSCWSYGVTPEHVSHFAPRTLQLLVQRAGFRVVAVWTRSYAADPRLIYDTMRKLGRSEQLMRWCGREDGSFDQEAYIRFLTDRRLPNWISNRMWPARLVELLGLGEEVHLVAKHSL